MFLFKESRTRRQAQPCAVVCGRECQPRAKVFPWLASSVEGKVILTMELHHGRKNGTRGGKHRQARQRKG